MYTRYSHLTQESAFRKSARIIYRSARGLYQSIRAIKNHLINLTDQPIIILLYHRVADLPSDPEMLAVTPMNFLRHMEFIKQEFPIVRFDEDWSNVKKPAVAVTFDDGYADNVLEALPVLEKVGVPATFFISSGHLGTDRIFWWNRLENILLQDGYFPSTFTLDDVRNKRTWDTGTSEQRKMLYSALFILMLKATPVQREGWLNQLEQWAGLINREGDIHRSMTQDEIKRLAVSPWTTIGAHTVTHSALSALNEEQQRQEILTSKQDLENLTGMKITTFSYPFGRKRDYNRASVRLCREAGFVKAASNFPGQVHRWTDLYQLPRHLVRNWDIETFAVEMKSFWTR